MGVIEYHGNNTPLAKIDCQHAWHIIITRYFKHLLVLHPVSAKGEPDSRHYPSKRNELIIETQSHPDAETS
jgi:hypothetical protein